MSPALTESSAGKYNLKRLPPRGALLPSELDGELGMGSARTLNFFSVLTPHCNMQAWCVHARKHTHTHNLLVGMVTQSYNSSSQKAEAGGLLPV